jgi:hypothetical protein
MRRCSGRGRGIRGQRRRDEGARKSDYPVLDTGRKSFCSYARQASAALLGLICVFVIWVVGCNETTAATASSLIERQTTTEMGHSTTVKAVQIVEVSEAIKISPPKPHAVFFMLCDGVSKIGESNSDSIWKRGANGNVWNLPIGGRETSLIITITLIP